MSNMFTRIMVPLDGSELAAEALPRAMQLMRRVVDTLHLVTVIPPLSSLAADYGASEGGGFTGEGQSREAAYLSLVADRLRAEGVAVTTAVLRGPAARALREYAELHDIELIVMTSHGRGGFSRFWLGSVTDELVKQSPVPLLCHRLLDNSTVRAEPVTRVLVPLDGSPQAEDALEPALVLAARLHATVELLRVVDPTTQVWAGVTEVPVNLFAEDLVARKLEAHGYLQEIKDRIRPRAIEVHTSVRTAVRAADAIVARAREQAGTAVVMVTRRTGLLDRMILGSVTDKVLRSTPGPVLVCHPQAGTPDVREERRHADHGVQFS